jgi:hypothetical protein
MDTEDRDNKFFGWMHDTARANIALAREAACSVKREIANAEGAAGDAAAACGKAPGKIWEAYYDAARAIDAAIFALDVADGSLKGILPDGQAAIWEALNLEGITAREGTL